MCCIGNRMDPFERYTRERGAVEDAVRAGRAVREVERRSRRISAKPRTPQRPAGSDLAWIRNNSGMSKMGGQLNNSMADRSGNVAKAKAAGTFDRTREEYNTANAGKGYFMNQDGTIAEPGTAPKAPAKAKAPTPPEKPNGPPGAAPQPPAPPQAKTPAPVAPTVAAAKAAPKTTPKMQEFFKSHAQKSGRPNQYFDDKGNPRGKAPTESPKVAAPEKPVMSIDQTIAQARSTADVVRAMQRTDAPENTTPEGRAKIISSLPDYAPAPKVAESAAPATPPVETPKPQPTAPPAMKKSFAGQIMENIKANTKGTPVGNLLSDASKEVSGYAKAVAPGIKAVNAAVGAAVKPLTSAAVEAPRKVGEAVAASPGFKGSQIDRQLAKKKPAVAAN